MNHLFRNLPDSLISKIERSLYNRRKRRLAYAINQIRLKLTQRFYEFEDCFILDSMYKGYLSQSVQLDLFSEVNIKLETPKGINQKDYKPQFYLFKKYRKRIEALFSQLCE